MPSRRNPALPLPLWAALFLAGIGAWTAGPARAENGLPALNQGPMIRLAERRWDFGATQQHELLRHIFRFRNDGTDALIIRHVEPDCGCTEALAVDTLLVPGRSSEIRITVDTKALEGDQQKVVSVYTNDPAEPRIDLVLTMTVKPFIEVEPRALDFKEVHRGDTPMLSARLTAARGIGFQVTGAKGGEERVSWKITPVPADSNGACFLVEARLRPDAPYGRFFDRVEIAVKHPQVRSEKIYLKGDVYSYFTLPDQRIRFIPLQPGEQNTQEIEILADGSQPYEITGATASVPYLKPVLAREGTGYTLRVTLSAPDQQMRFNEQVTLHTTDPHQPEIPIEVKGSVAIPPPQTKPGTAR
jgi:hypothetical protein